MGLLNVDQRGLVLPGRKPSMRLPRGITAYWPLDAANCEFGSGQVRPLDLIGNNYGVNANSPGEAGGPPGNNGGIFYKGVDASTFIGLNADPLNGVAASALTVTIAAWCYWNAYNTFEVTAGQGARIFAFANVLMGYMDDGSATGLGYPAGSIGFESASGTTLIAVPSVVIPLNTWTHVAITINGGIVAGSAANVAIYINGVAVTVVGTANVGFSTPAGWSLGCREQGFRVMKGKMAHAMVCNGTVLTADEIADLYYSTFVPDEVMPALFVAAAGGSFIPAWALNSNLPVIGTGTY